MNDIFVWDGVSEVPENVTSVRIQDGVTVIPCATFYRRRNLRTVEIPGSVTEISSSAFYNCTSLTDITIPDSVTVIGDSVFQGCSSLTSIVIPDSVKSLGYDAFKFCTSLSNIKISSSITSIDDGTFAYCDSLTSITIPDGVTSIGEEAFLYCSKLKNVTIPEHVDIIGKDAFEGTLYMKRGYDSMNVDTQYDLFEALNRAHELDEAAFSGGMAGDNSASGGTIRGRGASTQPGKNNYLNRMKSKNPDLVDTMVIKVSDIKPGMITQAGQVKEAEARDHVSGGKKMYIMHTNGYDGFWGLDETMDVMVDPDNKSKPFAGDYRSLLKMGLKESLNESKITDFISSDMLHKMMHHPGFGSFHSYCQLDNMMVELSIFSHTWQGKNYYSGRPEVSTMGDPAHRYFKFVRSDGGWEAYEVSRAGEKLGEPFSLDI